MNTALKQPDYRTSHLSPDRGASYDRNFEEGGFRAFLWRQERAVLDRILRENYAGRSVEYLDFACGSGRILGHVAGQADAATGIDVSPSMLAKAREKAPRAQFVVGDLTQKDWLGGRKFNLITAFRFFPNAQDELRVSAMRAIRAHLGKDGLLVFNNHCCDSGSLFRVGRLLGKRTNTMSSEKVRTLVSESGMEIVKSYALGVLPATDGHMLVPSWVHIVSDRLAGAAGLADRFAQDIIYVCRRAGDAAIAQDNISEDDLA